MTTTKEDAIKRAQRKERWKEGFLLLQLEKKLDSIDTKNRLLQQEITRMQQEKVTIMAETPAQAVETDAGEEHRNTTMTIKEMIDEDDGVILLAARSSRDHRRLKEDHDKLPALA